MAKDQEKMSLELSQDQFQALLKVVYLGNWMANAHRNGSEEDPFKEEYREIENYIFSQAQQFGLEEYVENDQAEEGKFYPTNEFEEETDVHELHEDYDEQTFWDELIHQLGGRDFRRQYSQEEVQAMTEEEMLGQLHQSIGKWADEIYQNGLERLELRESDR